jgi:hypothetical protein
LAKEKKTTSVPPDNLRLYEELVARPLGANSKSNFGAAYTAVNGNMCSLISKYGVVGIRLPEPDRSAFLEKYDAYFSGRPGVAAKTRSTWLSRTTY